MHCKKTKECQRVNYSSYLQISACPGDRGLDIHIFRHHKRRLKLRSCFALATATPCNGPETEAAFHQQWPHTKFVGDRSCGAIVFLRDRKLRRTITHRDIAEKMFHPCDYSPLAPRICDLMGFASLA